MALIMVEKPKLEVVPPVVMVEPAKVFVQPQSEMSSSIEALTMEYLELHKKFVYFEVKTMIKRMDDIRKQLQSIANETMDENKPAIFKSPEGEMEFSERGKVSEVPDPLNLIDALVMKFGTDVAATVVDIAITPLRKILTDYELKQHLVEKPGGRTLRAVRPA